jgi:outer membrane protein TolC
MTARRGILTLVLAAGTAGLTAQTQTLTDSTSQIDYAKGASAWPNFTRVYETPKVAPLVLRDSNRLERLIDNGKLYLSLGDAIALALENNLDVAYARYEPLKADTDILRAKSGAQLRGVQTQISTLSTGQSSGAGVSGGGGGTGNITGVQENSSLGGGASSIGAASSFFGTQSVSLDPVMFGQMQWGHYTNLQTSNFVTGTSTVVNAQSYSLLGFQKGFTSGATVNLNWNNSVVDSNQQRLFVNPSLRTWLNLRITQPLLQGFGRSVNARQIRVARNSREISDLVFRQQIIAVVTRIQLAYWDLVTLRAMADARREDLRVAQQLYDDNRLRVQIGTLAPVDLTRSEGEVAQRRQDLTLAEGRVRRQEVMIKNALSADGLASPFLMDVEIMPTDGMMAVPEVEQIQPVQDLIAMALQSRPELAQSRIQLTNNDMDLKAIRNAMLPSVDAYVSFTNNGLVGTFNDTGEGIEVSDYFLGGLGKGLGQIFRRNFPDYVAGVQVSLPLKNRRAQADMAASLLERRQQDIRLRQQENSIRADVQNVVIDLQEARAQYEVAREGRMLQQKTLDGEQQRFNLGRADILSVVQAQRDLALARVQELGAQNSYVRAKVNLQLTTGQTLEANNIQLEEAYTGSVSREPDPIPANLTTPQP